MTIIRKKQVVVDVVPFGDNCKCENFCGGF